jgi:hypothetical protein
MTSKTERLDKYRSQARTPSGLACHAAAGDPGRPVP